MHTFNTSQTRKDNVCQQATAQEGSIKKNSHFGVHCCQQGMAKHQQVQHVFQPTYSIQQVDLSSQNQFVPENTQHGHPANFG
jgi:hypothetical protein